MLSEINDQIEPRELGLIDRILAYLEAGLGGLAALFIFVLMMLGVGQIAVRLLWNYPIPGYIDVVELLMAVVAFAAIGYAERLRAHIRMDFLPGVMPARWRPAYEAFLSLVAMLAVTSLVYATWFSFTRSWSLGDSTMDIRAPIWPSKLLLFVALSMLWLRLALGTVGFLRLWREMSR
jgi:TRAP-type mannitol/chloroaromatic compound transport system permease small subunit